MLYLSWVRLRSIEGFDFLIKTNKNSYQIKEICLTFRPSKLHE